jgi:cytochrome c oxidase subunit 1
MCAAFTLVIGWTKTVNVTLARTLFWFFGHGIGVFLVCACLYHVLYILQAGRRQTLSDLAGRIAAFLFLLFSVPVGVHHQFSDPSITQGIKMFQGLLTYGVAIPSFITAFTIAASLEYAGRKRGAKGWFGWMGKLPYLDPSKFLFAYLICGLFLFILVA